MVVKRASRGKVGRVETSGREGTEDEDDDDWTGLRPFFQVG